MPEEESQEPPECEPIDIGTFIHPQVSLVSIKVELRRLPYGLGMFTKAPIAKDELIICWSGKIMHLNDVLSLPPHETDHILQIDEEIFQVPLWPGYTEPANYTNHSCEPNSGFGKSPINLVAMRHIEVGEEITFDYSMSDSIDYLSEHWDCLCGKPPCRKKIRGYDWTNTELQNRYDGYFSPYLQRKIDLLKQPETVRGQMYPLNIVYSIGV